MVVWVFLPQKKNRSFFSPLAGKKSAEEKEETKVSFSLCLNFEQFLGTCLLCKRESNKDRVNV